MAEFVCAVDVGTGSARAGIVDRAGRMVGRAEHPIAMQRSGSGHAEHDSENIWAAFAPPSAPRAKERACPPTISPASVSTPPARWSCAAATGGQLSVSDGGRPPLGHDRVARPSRAGRSRRMHRHRPSRARPYRRRDVARNGNAEADVAEAPSARDAGTRPAISSTSRIFSPGRPRGRSPARNAR